MITNRENNPGNSIKANRVLKQIVIKSILCFLLMTVLSRMISKRENEYDVIKNVTGSPDEIETDSEQELSNFANAQKTENKIVKQYIKLPSCPKSYLLIILEEICTDLIIKKELCTPEDFYNHKKHKFPRSNIRTQSKAIPKVPAIINYAVGCLLIMSVAAALIELYKAKRQSPKKNGKNSLSRKSSLADLTVLKHHRKELIRRESIMEVPEESGHLKQLGFVPPPLYRRCSFPVGPHTTIADRSIIQDSRSFMELTRKMSFVDNRRTTVVDSRRTSVDCRNIAIDGRRISLDNSPERRHHRLVHRH